MVNVNKKYLEKELISEGWKTLWKKLIQARSEKELKGILGRLFSPAERIVFEKRLIIPLLLAKKLSYREIGRILDVPPGTISASKKRRGRL